MLGVSQCYGLQGTPKPSFLGTPFQELPTCRRGDGGAPAFFQLCASLEVCEERTGDLPAAQGLGAVGDPHAANGFLCKTKGCSKGFPLGLHRVCKGLSKGFHRRGLERSYKGARGVSKEVREG